MLLVTVAVLKLLFRLQIAKWGKSRQAPQWILLHVYTCSWACMLWAYACAWSNFPFHPFTCVRTQSGCMCTLSSPLSRGKLDKTPVKRGNHFGNFRRKWWNLCGWIMSFPSLMDWNLTAPRNFGECLQCYIRM